MRAVGEEYTLEIAGGLLHADMHPATADSLPSVRA